MMGFDFVEQRHHAIREWGYLRAKQESRLEVHVRENEHITSDP